MRDKRISSSKNLEKHSYTNTTEGVGLNFSYIFNPEMGNKFKAISLRSGTKYQRLKAMVNESLRRNSSTLEALAEIKPGERTNFSFVGFGKKRPISVDSYKNEQGWYEFTRGTKTVYARNRKDIIPELVNLIL